MEPNSNGFWFPFYSSAWLGSDTVIRMCSGDRGTWIMLLAYYHANNQRPISLDPWLLSRKLNTEYRDVCRFLVNYACLLDIRTPEGNRWEMPAEEQCDGDLAEGGKSFGSSLGAVWGRKLTKRLRLLPKHSQFTIPIFDEFARKHANSLKRKIENAQQKEIKNRPYQTREEHKPAPPSQVNPSSPSRKENPFTSGFTILGEEEQESQPVSTESRSGTTMDEDEEFFT